MSVAVRWSVAIAPFPPRFRYGGPSAVARVPAAPGYSRNSISMQHEARFLIRAASLPSGRCRRNHEKWRRTQANFREIPARGQEFKLLKRAQVFFARQGASRPRLVVCTRWQKIPRNVRNLRTQAGNADILGRFRGWLRKAGVAQPEQAAAAGADGWLVRRAEPAETWGDCRPCVSSGPSRTSQGRSAGFTPTTGGTGAGWLRVA